MSNPTRQRSHALQFLPGEWLLLGTLEIGDILRRRPLLLGPARSSAIWAGWAGANGARLNEPIGGDAVLTLHELLYFPLVIVRFADYHCSLRQMLTFTWTRTRLSATMLIEHRDVGPREPQPRPLPGGPRNRLHACHYHVFIAPVPFDGVGGWPVA